MSFVVNGADWDFNGLTPDQARDLIDRALEFIETSRQRGEEVAVGDDFQTRLMHGEANLWDLFGKEAAFSLPNELSWELAAWLSRAPRYANSEVWPDGFGDGQITIGEACPLDNLDVAWAHCATRGGQPTACLTLGDARIAVTTMGTNVTDVHFVIDENSRTAFWRAAIILTGDSLGTLLRYAPHAYPALHFIDGVLNDAGRLAGGYSASRQRIQVTLATLNDWGHWVFTWPPPALMPGEATPINTDKLPTNQIIEHRFAGLHLDAAPENPDVRTRTGPRKAREATLAGRTLYCEWHIKLEGHRNRVHFHGPVPESDDKVVIGMIHEHLPLI
ncbi:hypothetical protein [Sphingobium yanoikuyae]|uniref:hypothetical protein n=1 Tax=Sphingobium yanoikuyae TaxID=13690 RepID=UPI0026F0C5E8|nr:hypothetical protein [Sphingobium yanoikuyae]